LPKGSPGDGVSRRIALPKELGEPTALAPPSRPPREMLEAAADDARYAATLRERFPERTCCVFRHNEAPLAACPYEGSDLAEHERTCPHRAVVCVSGVAMTRAQFETSRSDVRELGAWLARVRAPSGYGLKVLAANEGRDYFKPFAIRGGTPACEERVVYVALAEKGSPVAVASLSLGEDPIRIYKAGVLNLKQGRGLGSVLLQCVKEWARAPARKRQRRRTDRSAGLSQRRRGRQLDSPSSARGGAAAATSEVGLCGRGCRGGVESRARTSQ